MRHRVVTAGVVACILCGGVLMVGGVLVLVETLGLVTCTHLMYACSVGAAVWGVTLCLRTFHG